MFACLCRPPFLLFSGGMPRASYGDRHCITVIHGKKHVALDFTSRIIDFFVIRDGPEHTGRPHTPTNWQQNYSTFKYGTLKVFDSIEDLCSPVSDVVRSYKECTNILNTQGNTASVFNLLRLCYFVAL